MLLHSFNLHDTVLIIMIRLLIYITTRVGDNDRVVNGITNGDTVRGFHQYQNLRCSSLMNQKDALREKKYRYLFIDAEGTLYVPRNGRSRWEFWSAPSPEWAVDFFELDHGVVEALRKLREISETICLVSRNTKPILTALLEKFGIRDYFDAILINGDKGKRIEEYLEQHGLDKAHALMVGDMPVLDIFPLRRVGIDAILIDRDYNQGVKAERIAGLRELPDWLRIADIVEEIGHTRVFNATLDHFASASNSHSPSRNDLIRTKSLIAVPSA